jgi:hypothetical protein
MHLGMMGLREDYGKGNRVEDIISARYVYEPAEMTRIGQQV